MKPPKLPGTEKFKFSDKKYDNSLKSESKYNNDDNICDSPNFMRGIPSRSTCPSSSLTTPPTFNRFDSKRKPILPISSRMTSRVLTLTHLTSDSFDIRDYHSCQKPLKSYNNYLNASVTPVSCASRTPTITTASRVSLVSDSSGSRCSSSQPSPRSLCSPLDRSITSSHWAKNAHRLSTSSQSSWEDSPDNSPESIWISRK